MDIQNIERMLYLWKDARAKYQSFFACLSEVHREIGSDALEAWCINNLGLGMEVINKTTKILRDVDADKLKRELAPAVETARRTKQFERARHEATLAELRKRTAETNAEAKALEKKNAPKKSTAAVKKVIKKRVRL